MLADLLFAMLACLLLIAMAQISSQGALVIRCGRLSLHVQMIDGIETHICMGTATRVLIIDAAD